MEASISELHLSLHLRGKAGVHSLGQARAEQACLGCPVTPRKVLTYCGKKVITTWVAPQAGRKNSESGKFHPASTTPIEVLQGGTATTS